MTFFSVIKLISTGNSNSCCLISTTQSFFDFYGYRRIFYNNVIGSSQYQYTQPIDYNNINVPSIYFYTLSVTPTNTTLSETLYTSNYNGTSYLKNPLTSINSVPIPNANYDTLGKISIGGRYQIGSNIPDAISIGGTISEVLVYNSVLDTTTINQMVGYLRNKWSI
jgi:hypothetical protein